MWRMSWNAGEFDRWYAQMGRSGLRDQIARRALGLPSGMDAGATIARVLYTEGLNHYGVAMKDPEGNEFDIG
jgi:hypothetical protein